MRVYGVYYISLRYGSQLLSLHRTEEGAHNRAKKEQKNIDNPYSETIDVREVEVQE